MIGKYDEAGEWEQPGAEWLLPAAGELTPATIARVIARRIARFHTSERIRESWISSTPRRRRSLPGTGMVRVPHYCSGCPHNSSTKVPEGSRALAGIGCHYMALWLSPDTTQTFSQMGGEGVPWVGQAPFTKTRHVFANLGDGTYSHSGLLAIRQAVAAQVSITYKILFNDAVAMTGGQPVEGTLTVPQIVRQVAAEGVERIVVVADDPRKYPSNAGIPSGVPIRERRELDAVQRELREFPGVSVLVYDQTCAAEKRRRRKRKTFPIRRSASSSTIGSVRTAGLQRQINCMSAFGRDGVRAQTDNRSVLLQQGFHLPRGVLPELRDRRGRQTAPGQGIGPRGAAGASSGLASVGGQVPAEGPGASVGIETAEAPGSDGSSLILEPPSGEPERGKSARAGTSIGRATLRHSRDRCGRHRRRDHRRPARHRGGPRAKPYPRSTWRASPRKAARSSRISGSPPGENISSRRASPRARQTSCSAATLLSQLPRSRCRRCDPARPVR